MQHWTWRAATLIGLIAALSTDARADIEGDEFYSKDWNVSIRAPGNWQMTEQTSYPNILVHLLRPYPAGRMLLSAERITPGLTPLEYANRTSQVLTKIGFRVRPPQLHSTTGAYWIDFDNGKAFLRQALLVSGRVAYALTLSAADSRIRSQHLRAFDATLRSMALGGVPVRAGRGAKPTPAVPDARPSGDKSGGGAVPPPSAGRAPPRAVPPYKDTPASEGPSGAPRRGVAPTTASRAPPSAPAAPPSAGPPGPPAGRPDPPVGRPSPPTRQPRPPASPARGAAGAAGEPETEDGAHG